jgi:hypothetical protein
MASNLSIYSTKLGDFRPSSSIYPSSPSPLHSNCTKKERRLISNFNDLFESLTFIIDITVLQRRCQAFPSIANLIPLGPQVKLRQLDGSHQVVLVLLGRVKTLISHLSFMNRFELGLVRFLCLNGSMTLRNMPLFLLQ